MGAIYILWLRELKRYVRSRVQIVVSLGQPCLYLLALGFGLRPGLQAGRPRQLSAVHGARRRRHDGAVQLRLLRHRDALGPPVRLPERDAGGARLAHADHVGRTLGGATVAVIQGALILVICLIAGFRPHQLARRFPLAFLFVVPDRGRLRRAGHRRSARSFRTCRAFSWS